MDTKKLLDLVDHFTPQRNVSEINLVYLPFKLTIVIFFHDRSYIQTKYFQKIDKSIRFSICNI